MSVASVLEQAIENGAFPGAAVAYGLGSEARFGYYGSHTYDEASQEVGEETLWDLASVTKVASTTTAALCLYQESRLDLDAHVTSFVPRFRHDRVRVRDLLTHRSGLPAYCSFQTRTKTVEGSEQELFGLDLRPAVPPKTEYSCMGFMILQRVVEAVTGKGLDEAVKELAHAPLGMDSTSYKPSLADRKRCAPTETRDDWRKEIEDQRGYERVNSTYIQGGVHDPAAFMVGGVSGNAGLFSTARDMALWAQELAVGGSELFDPAALRLWRTRQAKSSSRALGFDTKSPRGSSAGTLFGPQSFGHTGYTGTCLWVDPATKMWAVLLANRVHPTSANLKISKVRPAFHDAVWRELLR